ncbi:MAG: ArsR/SmtB family transcription factor [Prochloraceae cyanobacterium]
MSINILADNIDECQYRSMKHSNSKSQCCPPLLDGVIEKSQAQQLATLFRVLGEEVRLRILSLIAAQPEGKACVCDLTEELEVAQPTVSHHLKVLYQAGLLDKERRGNWIYYRLVPERFQALRQALMLPVVSDN